MCIICDYIGDDHLLGDILCILAALAISVSLVGEEFLIKEEIGIIDYMAITHAAYFNFSV